MANIFFKMYSPICSSIFVRKPAAMGIIASQLNYYMTKTDDPDPVTGLTSREKCLIQTSWAPVKKNLVGNGVTLLLLYFEKYPEEQQYFPFRDMPREQLKDNKKFQAHCSNVMYAFDSLVDGLNDSELLVSLLEKLGDRHKKHGVPPASFCRLKETILELFGGFMPKEALSAWDKMLKVGFSVVSKQL